MKSIDRIIANKGIEWVLEACVEKLLAESAGKVIVPPASRTAMADAMVPRKPPKTRKTNRVVPTPEATDTAPLEFDDPGDLSPSCVSVLAAIRDQVASTPKGLQKALTMKRPTVALALKRLVNGRLIRREGAGRNTSYTAV